MSSPTTPSGVRAWRAIGHLPESPEAIASFLHERGIRGRQHSPHCCPVANYLNREAGVIARVSPLQVLILDNQSTVLDYFFTPPSVMRFVMRFDDGAYPDIVEAE